MAAEQTQRTDPPKRGYCALCQREVVIDGRPGDAEGSVWSHMVDDVQEVVVPGHAYACQGDCHHHGCPVPVPDIEPYQRECGPVTPS